MIKEVTKKGRVGSMADFSFFFTNFPDHFFEKDLWKVFQRWGRVLDVFISRKLNSRNRRYGFVRFQGVEDAYALEKKLDAIWIGTWKLQVNIPKYSRSERMPKKRGEISRSTGRLREQLQQKKSIIQISSKCYFVCRGGNLGW